MKHSKSCVSRVLHYLRKGRGLNRWYTAWELQKMMTEGFGIGERMIFSESTITARIRDLRKNDYGSYTVRSRKRTGASSWEYQLQ